MKPYLPRTRASKAGEKFVQRHFPYVSEYRAFAYVDLFVAGYEQAQRDEENRARKGGAK